MKKDWFSLTPIRSHNADINFVTGLRGSGKSYAFKQLAIEDYIKNGKQFVMVRRYEDELATKGQLFDDIAHKYNLEFKVIGYKCYCRNIQDIDDSDELSSNDNSKLNHNNSKNSHIDIVNDNTRLGLNQEEEWEVIGFFIPLADQQKYKSTSFPNVNKICYDEVIIENQSRRYLKEEYDLFIGLVDTIGRDRPDLKIYMISNAGALSNPYFREWDVKFSDFVNSKNKIIKRMNGAVAIQWYDNQKLASQTRTRIDKISSKKYQEYASQNIFKDYDLCRVDPNKPPKATYILTITDGTRYMSIYNAGNQYYVDEKKRDKLYVTDPKTIINNATVINKKFKDSLKKLHNESRIIFHSLNSKFTFIDLILS